MGLNPAEQRRKLGEALDVIVELMRSGIVTKKTDGFDLREARLRLPSYTPPIIEMAVAANRSSVRALAAGRYGIGMLSISGTSDDALKAHANNWRLYEERTGWRQQAGPAQLVRRHVRACRRDARASARRRQVRAREFQTPFFRGSDLPDHPARRHERPAEYLVSTDLACIGTLEDCLRHFERLWKGSDGGLGGILLLAHNRAATKRSYELMGQLRPPAVPARRQRAAPVELRGRQVEVGDRRRRVTRCRASRDRQVSGRERRRNGDGPDRASGTAELSQRRRSDRTLTGSVVKRSSRRGYGRKGGHHEEIAISL
jgi:hypothetical protein